MKLSEKKNLYHRFLNKELNEEELDAFFQLVAQGEMDGDYLDIMPALDQELVKAPQFKLHPTVKLFFQIGVAAAVLLISSMSYLAYRRAEQLKQQGIFTVITVPVGSIKIITLKDHSVVTLTSGSVFKFPAAFAPDSRKVFLVRGKGFFEIAKDKTRPFTVYSAKLSTTALGTSFTVENYHAYQLEKVRLYTGRVEIGSREKAFAPVQLSPGQQYLHSDQQSGKAIFENIGEIQPHMEDGTLEFEGASLVEALIRVSSYYNTHIQFDGHALEKFSITGKFRNEPLPDVLHTLLFTHHLKFKKIPEGYLVMNPT